MRQHYNPTISLLNIFAFCVVSLAMQNAFGEEPSGESPAEAKARQEILDSQRWAEAKQQFDDWLSVQTAYSEAQVQALESEMRNRMSLMSAQELQVFLEEMEAKIAVLMSPATMDARLWANKYTEKARQRISKKFGVEDPMRMRSVQIEAALREFAADRQSKMATSAAFGKSRKSQAKAARSYHQAQAKIAARPSKAASYGGSSYAPRNRQKRVQTYPRGRYSVGPWGGSRRW